MKGAPAWSGDRMPSSLPDSSPVLVLASSFYTAALDKPFVEALSRRGLKHTVVCVPYNQLYSFLLNPLSVVPGNAVASVVLLLRVEDLVRLELAQSSKRAPIDAESFIPVFRQRTEELLAILGQVSRLRLTVMICPVGRGAFDIGFLGGAPRIAEHKIAAVLRAQKRHLIFGWTDFERAAKPGNWFNVAGDRLGHVPFSPEGLDELAEFFVDRIERIPNVNFGEFSDGSGDLDLRRFLDGLKVEVTIAPFTPDDEQQVIDLIRHTTHFINLAGRKWDNESLRALVTTMKGGECQVLRVQDRFGTYGTSGAVTYGFEGAVLRIGLLFLSCTVLGKQVEHALFAWIAQMTERRLADCIEVPFVPGPDNQGMRTLLAQLAGGDSAADTLASAQCFRLPVSGLAARVCAAAANPLAVPAVLSEVEMHG
jgi:hypothetical protein